MSKETYSNEELVCLIRSGEDGNGSLMLQLWEQNRRFVMMIANKYRGLAEYEDLMQESFIGLCSAVDRWERDSGVPFISYAALWIRQAVQRYIERMSPVSISVHQRIVKYRRFETQFWQTCGRGPTEAETCQFLGITERQLDTILRAAYVADVAHLDESVGDEECCSVGDLLPADLDVEGMVLDQVQQEELQAVIWPLVDSLNGKIPSVLRARYQEKKTLKQIGEECGCTLGCIREIEQEGLRELRRTHRRRLLQPYAEESIYSKALKWNGADRFNRTWTSSTERIAIEAAEGRSRDA